MNSRFRFFLLSALVAAVVSAGGITAVQLLIGKAHYTKPPRAEVLAACLEHAKLANQPAARRMPLVKSVNWTLIAVLVLAVFSAPWLIRSVMVASRVT